MLRESVIDESDYLEQAVLCGYSLPRLDGGQDEDLGSERFWQMEAEGD